MTVPPCSAFPTGLAPDCGQMQRSKMQSRMILALSERAPAQAAPMVDALATAVHALAAAIEAAPPRTEDTELTGMWAAKAD